MRCFSCGDEVSEGRARLGYKVCMVCGEKMAEKVRAGWCVAPMHKSNYMLVTRLEDLVGLNNKGGLVK